MPDLDIDVLTRIADVFTQGKGLSPSERVELLRIAQGYACKDSAASANVAPETIRARRKRIYRKVGVGGAGEAIASLLAIALKQIAAAPAVKAQPAHEASASMR